MKKAINISIFILLVSVFATVKAEAKQVTVQRIVQEDVSIVMSIQTEWKFRIYGGRLQKRLWSISEGKWLTQWLDA